MAGLPAHKILDTDSTSFYTHHWVKPHHSIFGLRHGYFENSDHYHKPSFDTTTDSTAIPHNTLGGWWSKVKGSSHAIGYHKRAMEGSVWVAGESV